jgi:Ca-activated chloride channel family protein
MLALGVSAQGVMIHDASTGDLLPIGLSHIDLDIEDQVAMVSSTQRFVNGTADTLEVKYGYPLPSAASATRVRWMLPDSVWQTASMVAHPQDTTLPGVGGGAQMDAMLQDYLGDSPLYFEISDPLPPGAWISVELSYVQLLPYANARVQLISASDYSTVLNGDLPEVSIDVSVRSQRALLGIDIAGTGAWSPTADAPFVSVDSAYLHVDDVNVPASCGFSIGYDLDPLAYGITSLSNYLPDSLVKCDQMENGFFVLLIEPEPSSEVVDKDFVIVIDKSGSMSGAKIQEARDAATFMVNNLNVGDAFNVIAFDSHNTPWTNGLQPYTAANMQAALTWIAAIDAGGGTNINEAITEGIEDFTTSPPGRARSIVFLTDGQDQSSNNVILGNAQQLRMSIAPDLQIFTFGIGEGFNEQLLNQLAVQNNGVSQFLETANFSQVMSDFYTQIQNPVLLNPTATFDHPDVQDLYPDPLMGLFVGQQMVIVGRYSEPGPTNLHLDGFASGSPVSFDFAFDLTAAFDQDKLFIPKIWAQKAVDALVNEYYGYAEGSDEAETLRDSIVSYSMCYGIGSPFTSFADVGGGGNLAGVEEEEQDEPTNTGVPVFPEPSLSNAPVVFDLGALSHNGRVVIRIYDALGQLLYEQDITAYCGGTWTWNGVDRQGREMKGELLYRITDGQDVRSGRLTRL